MDKRRCDGCGNRSSGLSVYRNESGHIHSRYCPGCDTLRKAREIDVGEHDQYKLRETKP